MIKTIKAGDFTMISVFKHRFEKSKTWRSDFRDWSLGVWFEKSKMVGKRDFSNPKKWGNEMVNSYTIGINLLICKFWISWDFGGMHIEEK
jgi:hypothetical protein